MVDPEHTSATRTVAVLDSSSPLGISRDALDTTSIRSSVRGQRSEEYAVHLGRLADQALDDIAARDLRLTYTYESDLRFDEDALRIVLDIFRADTIFMALRHRSGDRVLVDASDVLPAGDKAIAYVHMMLGGSRHRFTVDAIDQGVCAVYRMLVLVLCMNEQRLATV